MRRVRYATEGSEFIGSSTNQAAATLPREIDVVADIIRHTGMKQQ